MQSIENIADLAGVTVEEAYDFIYADWNSQDEHQQWLQDSSDEEIAQWIKAGKR